MRINRIKSRSILFQKNIPNEWDLNIHLIMGNKYNYLIDTGLGSNDMKEILDYIEQEVMNNKSEKKISL